MTIEPTLRTHEKWAVAVAAMAVLNPVLNLAISSSTANHPWPQPWWWTLLTMLSSSLLIRLAVGSWLAWTARRHGHSAVAWFAIGPVFSLLAAVLYFVLLAFGLRADEERPLGDAGPDPMTTATSR